MSIPAACIDSTSSNAKPSSRSITSTRRVTSVGCGRGTMIPRCSVAREHAGDVEHVLRLEPEVELLDHGLGEQLDERRRVGERGDGDPPDEAGRQPRERGDVVAEELRDPGPLHLHHDLLARDAGGRRGPARSRRRQRAVSSNSAKSVFEPSHRGRPRPRRGPSSNGSGGTWSRRSLNSETSSSGKRPSPPEMI